jgi:hypothetical protein
MSTAYHPQTDGQSERTNQTVETILRLYCNQEQDNWREWLPVVQYIINSRPSTTTKQSPYELWMGFVPRTHLINRAREAAQEAMMRPSKLPHFREKKTRTVACKGVHSGGTRYKGTGKTDETCPRPSSNSTLAKGIRTPPTDGL